MKKSKTGRMALPETGRLIFAELTPDMARAVHENSLDAENRRFVPDEVFETEEAAAETIAYLMDQYESADGPLVYPLLLRNGANIGYVQAVPMEDNDWEIGYHIGGKYTRQGYATEAVTAFLPAVMAHLGLQRIIGICVRDNIASRRVMEKCGFALQFEGVGSYQGEQRQICRYVYSPSPEKGKIIAACGNDCAACPRYTAPPYEKTEEQLKRTAELWRKIGYRDRVVSVQEIACTGCRAENDCRYQAVGCAGEKGLPHCGACPDYPCERMETCFRVTRSFEEACRACCTPEEFAQISRAFFEKEQNLRTGRERQP